MIEKIVINIIPHDDQRYETVGDWYWLDREKKMMGIYVSDMGDDRYSTLVGVHELLEVILCILEGVNQEDVDKFDLAYDGYGEPGDDPSAPYHRQHKFASQIECILAKRMGVEWKQYEMKVSSMQRSVDTHQDGKD